MVAPISDACVAATGGRTAHCIGRGPGVEPARSVDLAAPCLGIRCSMASADRRRAMLRLRRVREGMLDEVTPAKGDRWIRLLLVRPPAMQRLREVRPSVCREGAAACAESIRGGRCPGSGPPFRQALRGMQPTPCGGSRGPVCRVSAEWSETRPEHRAIVLLGLVSDPVFLKLRPRNSGR